MSYLTEYNYKGPSLPDKQLTVVTDREDQIDEFKEFSKTIPSQLLKWFCRGEQGEESILYIKNGKFCIIWPETFWPRFHESQLK